MKTKPTSLFFALWLAFALTVLPALRAQQETPPAAPTKQATPAEQTATADKAVDTEKSAPAPEAPAEAVKPAADDTKAAVAAEPSADDKKMEKAGETTAEPEKAASEEKKSKRIRTLGGSSRHGSGNERVSLGHDSTLAAGEQADAVVSIMGSSTSAGEVSDAVVSVFGNTRVTGGTVGDAAVAVLGDVYVNGHVKGQVVAVLGNVELGPDAVIDGEVVCVGGGLQRDAKAVLHGHVQNIALGGRHFNFTGLQTWFTQCVLYARPLAFNANLWWAWCIAFSFLVFYILLALVTPSGVRKCVATLEERPGYSILSGVLTLLLTPVAYLLLVLTLVIGIGFILIPLFSLGLFFAAIFGHVVMLAWLGRRITKLFGDGPLGLYTVPVLGFIVYKLLGVLGLGVVLYTLLLQYKASRPAPRPVPAIAAAVAPAAGVAAAGATESVPVSPGLPPVISAATLPRAGFWHRYAASLLDAVFVGIAFGMIHSIWHGFGGIFPFWYAAYCVIMWATKGTTIGGIICWTTVGWIGVSPSCAP